MRAKAVILAGGRGSRLWPLSRRNSPKQFLEIFERESLFQITLKRTLKLFSAADVFIIASSEYRFRVYNQIDFAAGISLRQKARLKKQVFFEPAPRSTLGAVVFLLKNLPSARPGDIFAIFPSDHIVYPLSSFRSSLKKAVQAAAEGKIAVLGALPQEASSEYGYILPASGGGVFAVKSFLEKPPPAKAKALIKKGALWNCGIFCFRRDVFESELKKTSPVFFRLYCLPQKAFNAGFSSLPSRSLDYGIMEKTSRGQGVRLKGRWSDLGTWESFFSFLRRLPEAARRRKKIAGFLNTSGCEVWSERLVVGAGIKDLLVVDTPGALLLLKKGKGAYVRNIVEFLKRKGHSEVENDIKVWRPWGYYKVLQEGGGYKVKEICLYPRKCISLQRHRRRSEHWNVVEGRARIILGKKEVILRRNESIFVRKMQKHKVCNPSGGLLKIIEVQIGDYLGEDDIERFDLYEQKAL